MIDLTKNSGSVLFTIRVIPRSSRTEIVGEHDGALKIKLKSPPVDGAANDELIRFLSRVFSVPRSNVALVSGHTSRTKRIAIRGVSTANITAILQAKT